MKISGLLKKILFGQTEDDSKQEQKEEVKEQHSLETQSVFPKPQVDLKPQKIEEKVKDANLFGVFDQIKKTKPASVLPEKKTVKKPKEKPKQVKTKKEKKIMRQLKTLKQKKRLKKVKLKKRIKKVPKIKRVRQPVKIIAAEKVVLNQKNVFGKPENMQIIGETPSKVSLKGALGKQFFVSSHEARHQKVKELEAHVSSLAKKHGVPKQAIKEIEQNLSTRQVIKSKQKPRALGELEQKVNETKKISPFNLNQKINPQTQNFSAAPVQTSQKSEGTGQVVGVAQEQSAKGATKSVSESFAGIKKVLSPKGFGKTVVQKQVENQNKSIQTSQDTIEKQDNAFEEKEVLKEQQIMQERAQAYSKIKVEHPKANKDTYAKESAEETIMTVSRPLTTGSQKQAHYEILGLIEEIQKHRILTDFDRVYEFVQQKQRARIGSIAKDLGITKKRIEDCAQILEEDKLIEVDYPAVGEAFLQVPEYKEKMFEEKKKLKEKKAKEKTKA